MWGQCKQYGRLTLNSGFSLAPPIRTPPPFSKGNECSYSSWVKQQALR